MKTVEKIKVINHSRVSYDYKCEWEGCNKESSSRWDMQAHELAHLPKTSHNDYEEPLYYLRNQFEADILQMKEYVDCIGFEEEGWYFPYETFDGDRTLINYRYFNDEKNIIMGSIVFQKKLLEKLLSFDPSSPYSLDNQK